MDKTIWCECCMVERAEFIAYPIDRSSNYDEMYVCQDCGQLLIESGDYDTEKMEE